jgi:CHASE3 domain sensor protein
MKLTVGKKINGSFMVLALVSSITGGLILYWLIDLTAANRTVLSIHTPSMIEAERLLRYYGLAIGGIKGFIAFGDEKYLQDYENAKTEIQESYKKLKELSKNWIIPKNRNLLEEMEGYLHKFYASANQLLEKKHSSENNTAEYYFEANLEPFYKSIHEKVDNLFTILADMPSSESVKNAIIAAENVKAGTIHSHVAIRRFLEDANEKYRGDYENGTQLRFCGLHVLQEVSKDLTNNVQELATELIDGNEQFLNQTKKVFDIRRENDYRLDLKYLKEELSPLVASMQNSVDQIEINMAKLLENEVQTALRLQKSMWFIASIAVFVSVVSGIFIVVLNTKYLILSWPRKLVRPSQV